MSVDSGLDSGSVLRKTYDRSEIERTYLSQVDITQSRLGNDFNPTLRAPVLAASIVSSPGS